MFIDARLIQGKIHLNERDKNGKRRLSVHAPPYVYFTEDKFGTLLALDGTKVKRHVNHDRRVHERKVADAKDSGKRVYESDVYPVFRFLEERYPTDDNPPLHVCLIDIEADKDPERGWSKPRDPFTPMTAVTLNLKWLDQYVTIATPPDTLTFAEARALLDSDPGDGFGPLTEDHGYILVEDEATMLLLMLELLDDADIISGWNSAYYDLPYIIGRIRLVLGGEDIETIKAEDGENVPFAPSEDSIPHLLMLCAFPDLPKCRRIEKFGNIELVFDLPGRPHLDYLELYQKNNMKKHHSYTLDYILYEEIKQTKVKYDGSLDQLQRKDFRRFIAYSRQDVAGLSALDDKKKMIELANTIAHLSSVTFDKIMGTVTKIEMAILRRLHRKGIVANDRVEQEQDGAVPGAFVVEPDGGLYWWVVSFDINSLYPSIIRALNISPETLIGQFDLTRTETKFNEALHRHKGDIATAWGEFTGTIEYHDLIGENPVNLTLVYENGDETCLPAADWKRILRENNWCTTANGTVFDLSREGIITESLTAWYEGRAEKREESRKYAKLAAKAKAAGDAEKAEELAALAEACDIMMNLADEAQVIAALRAKADEFKTLADYFDMVQNALKLILNSTYGAYLNRFFRFYDSRCGRSVTLSGRVITKHMIRYASYLMTGQYDFDKRAIIYGDTDSAYTTIDYFIKQIETGEIVNRLDDAPPEVLEFLAQCVESFGEHEDRTKGIVAVADILGKAINASFPAYVASAFLVPETRGEIIGAKRENVARRGLFKNAKKRYALHVIDEEGKPADDIKTTGMDTKRTDTPKYIQKFLEQCLDLLLKQGKDKDDLLAFINDYRETFNEMAPWRRGTPCGVSKLGVGRANQELYMEDLMDGYVGMKKAVQHYSVKAGLNTNRLMDIHNEHRWDYIHDGDKIEILYLRKNEYGMDCVAIKVGEDYVPDWFKRLPFDNDRHEQKLVTQKLDNTFGILGWDFEPNIGFLDELFA